MQKPGGSLGPNGYWILGILGAAFISLMVRLRMPSLTAPQSRQTLIFSIALPAMLAVMLVLVTQPRTRAGKYVRHTILAILLLTVLAPASFAFLLVLTPFAWLVAYLLGRNDPPVAEAILSGESAPVAGTTLAPAANLPADTGRRRRRKLVLLAIIGAFVLVSLAGRLIYLHHQETSALLFIGIPALLAVLMVQAVTPKSAMGSAMAGITFALLLSAVLFGEGLICIIMAAPIFYAVGAIIAAIVQSSRQSESTTKMMLLLPLLLMSFEGTSIRTSLPREQFVSAQRTVIAHRGEVETALAAPPQFRTPLPFYLRMGFPRPVFAKGAGLAVGNRRIVGFDQGETKPRELVMEVANIAPQMVTFRMVSDESKIADWLHWEDAVVSWQQLDDNHAVVTWTLHYRRNLDPAWYFEPWERYGTSQAASYLIENVIAAKSR